MRFDKDAVQSDLRGFGVLATTAGLVGLFIEPASLDALYVGGLGLIAWFFGIIRSKDSS